MSLNIEQTKQLLKTRKDNYENEKKVVAKLFKTLETEDLNTKKFDNFRNYCVNKINGDNFIFIKNSCDKVAAKFFDEKLKSITKERVDAITKNKKLCDDVNYYSYDKKRCDKYLEDAIKNLSKVEKNISESRKQDISFGKKVDTDTINKQASQKITQRYNKICTSESDKKSKECKDLEKKMKSLNKKTSDQTITNQGIMVKCAELAIKSWEKEQYNALQNTPDMQEYLKVGLLEDAFNFIDNLLQGHSKNNKSLINALKEVKTKINAKSIKSINVNKIKEKYANLKDKMKITNIKLSEYLDLIFLYSLYSSTSNEFNKDDAISKFRNLTNPVFLINKKYIDKKEFETKLKEIVQTGNKKTINHCVSSKKNILELNLKVNKDIFNILNLLYDHLNMIKN